MKPWLHDLPSHWKVRSLQYLCEIGTGERDTIDATDDGEIPFFVRSKVVQRIDRATHDGEAVLTPGDGSVGEVFHHHRSGPFAAHQRVYVLNNFAPDLNPRFFYWYFSATFRFVTGQGTAKSTVESLRLPMFLSFPVAFPPMEEQKERAAYLDREIAEIDAMGSDLERLTELVKERFQHRVCSLGNRLVGDHEPKTTLKFLLQKVIRPVETSDGVVTAFRDGQVTLRSLRREGGFTMSQAEGGYQGVELGDFVFHGLDGFAGAVGVSEARGKASPVYHVCVATEATSEVFMAWALRALAAVGYLEAHAWSVRQRSVDYRNWQMFSSLPLAVIPKAEQKAVVDELVVEAARAADMKADLHRLQTLLAERRANLITEVVTGRKEIG